MAEAKPNMPTGNEDLGAEASEHVQVKATRVEDQALWDLGINIRENVRENRDAQYVTEGIVNSIRDRIGNLTRFNINESQLRAEMRNKIGAAMERSSGMGGTFEHLKMLREVASAVTSAIPPEVIHQLVNQRFAQALPPQYLDAMDMLLEPGRIRVDATVLGQSRDLIIDTQSPFWTQNDFKDEPALVKGLDGKTLREAGMVIRGVHDSHIITDTEAVNIASKKATVNRLPDTNAVVDEMVTDTAKTPLRLQVNIRRFVERMIDDPVVLVAIGATSVTRIGSLDQTQLTTLLTGPYTYWNECVTGVPNAGMTILVPTLGGSPASHPAHEYVLERIYAILGKTSPPLAHSTTSSLVDIHRDVLSNAKANPYAQLRDGSENHLGAAIAAVLVTQDQSLSSLIQNKDIDLEKKLREAEDNVYLLTLLEKLEQSSVPTGTVGMDILQNKLEMITKEENTLTSKAYQDTITIGEGAVQEDYKIGQDYNRSRGATTAPDHASASSWLAQRKKETLEKQKAFVEMIQRMKPIFLFLQGKNRTTGLIIMELFNADRAPQYNQMTLEIMNPKSLAEDVRSKYLELKGLTKAQWTEKAETLRNKFLEISEGKSKGLVGDAAQHAVVKQHFITHEHMNEPDAARATNYLLGRSLLDPELAASARSIAAELHGSNPRPEFVLTNVKEELFGREETIVADVAEGCGFKVKRGSTLSLDWLGFRERGVQVRWADETSGGYRKLMTAYFVLRKLMRGEGTMGMKLSETKFMQRQMQAITETLVQKHLPAMLKDFGPQLKDEEKQLLMAPQKQEHKVFLKELLEGSPPQDVEPTIARALQFAEERWKRYSWRFGGALGVFSDRELGMISGSRNPVSLAGLLYRNPRFGLKGMYYTGPKAQLRAAKKVGGAVVRKTKASWEDTKAKKWSMTKWGLAGFLLGGPVGLGVGLVGGKLFGRREAPAGGGH